MTSHNPPTTQQLDEIAARAAGLYEYATGLDQAWQDEADHLAGTDVPLLLAEVRRLNTALAAAQALATDAAEYRVPLPDDGGTTLIVRRQNVAHGTGWAVSVPAHGGGRAWTTEGWQESISALSVDRLFCWPDASTAIAEARRALAACPGFEKEHLGVSDAKRRLANCKHCGQPRAEHPSAAAGSV